jgi:Holliday junction resolvasome RuvABC endonuclease subunit
VLFSLRNLKLSKCAGSPTTFEYAPLRIKQAIIGSGASSKEQVAYFLKQMFGMTIMPSDLDATDGLAAAVCHSIREMRHETLLSEADFEVG